MAHTKLLRIIESFRVPDRQPSFTAATLLALVSLPRRCVCKAEDVQKRLLGEEGMRGCATVALLIALAGGSVRLLHQNLQG